MNVGNSGLLRCAVVPVTMTRLAGSTAMSETTSWLRPSTVNTLRHTGLPCGSYTVVS